MEHDAPLRDALRALAVQLDEAAGARDPRDATLYAIGGGRVRLHGAHGPALARLLVALTPLRLPDAGSDPAELDLFLWDAAHDAPALPRSPLLARDGLPPSGLGGYSDAGLNAFFQPEAGALSIYDARSRRAHWWLRDAATVPYFERAAPFKHILQWWIAQRGGALLHSAAVASSAPGTDRGVLVAGPSGSGKSSTALACLAHGLGFVSDDYVIVDGGEPPRVHMAYGTAKVVRASLARFARFAPHFRNLEQADEKPMLFVHEFAPASVRTSFVPRAIVLPRVAHAPRTTFAPLAPAAMLRALAPSSLMLFPLAGARAFTRIAALCRRTPCLVAHLADDADDVAAAFARLIDGDGEFATHEVAA
ncbi:MAG: hypothetical protein JSR18_01500 [Proteobacteria bacterium]|nr:hypothetical protein [Pseudomonadota bacterium]